MDALRKAARALLESGAVKVVLGYAAGSTAQRRRPVFLTKPDECDRLVCDEHCKQSLAVYLPKPEVRAMGKPAIVAPLATLRALLQLASENQLVDGAVVALAVSGSEVKPLETLAAIEEFVAQQPHGLSPAELAEVAKIDAMSREERWAYWARQLERCVKCYACRAACPMCYCTRCVVENNQPQWLPVASTPLGNLEWNIVRAMHLAGRCVDCGSCAAACPEGIRLDLLNNVLTQEAAAHFGATAGLSVRRDYALSAFKPDDKEDFIR
jgi:ferredoxin